MDNGSNKDDSHSRSSLVFVSTMPALKDISEEEVFTTVSNHLGHSSFQIIEFKVRPASEHALGFLGDHARMDVTFQIGKEPAKNVRYFIKTIPCKAQSHYDYTEKTRASYKEIELYKTLLPDVRDAITPGRKTLKWMPEFYYSRDSELFIIEDLSVDGFYMYPDRAALDLEHSEKAIQVMAVMHAAAIIFEEKLKMGKTTTRSSVPGKNIEELYSHLLFETEVSDIVGHPGNTFCETGFRSQKDVIDLFPGYTAQQRKLIEENVIEKLRQLFLFVKPSQIFRNVLLHGDLWSNNYLFRKNDLGEVSDAIMIDFQLVRYGPPAHDLLMFLYLTNTRDFRDKQEKYLLDLYYKKLQEELSAEGLDVGSLLPRSEFEASVDYYREFAILNSILYFQVVITPPQIGDEIYASDKRWYKNMYEDRSDTIRACFKEDFVCRSRMTEAMREMAEFYKWA